MTTYETVMVMLTCLAFIMTVVGIIVKLLLIIIKKEFEANFKGPENMKDQIIDGQIKKAFGDKVLMEQPYILDDSMTVAQFIKNAVAKTGENITVSQFKRLEVGVTE